MDKGKEGIAESNYPGGKHGNEYAGCEQMKLTIVCVGTVRGMLREATQDYQSRIGRYFKLDIVEVSEGRGSAARIRQSEAERLTSRLPDNSRIYALTRQGKPVSSRDLADQLGEMANYGPSNAVFVLGGAYGLGEQVLSAADRTVSLSDLTLPHEMARLVLLEQLYRAGTILRGEPYHKGN